VLAEALGKFPDEIESRLSTFELVEWSVFFRMRREAEEDAMRKAKMKSGR
jgi:hypothetical protein